MHWDGGRVGGEAEDTVAVWWRRSSKLGAADGWSAVNQIFKWQTQQPQPPSLEKFILHSSARAPWKTGVDTSPCTNAAWKHVHTNMGFTLLIICTEMCKWMTCSTSKLVWHGGEKSVWPLLSTALNTAEALLIYSSPIKNLCELLHMNVVF